MATWVRLGTGTAPTATNFDLIGDYALDNATAPGDFDPAAVTSVRCQWTITGSGFADDSWDNVIGVVLETGATAISSHAAEGSTGNQNIARSSDNTDSTGIPAGLSVAQWEAALVRGGGGLEEWCLWNKVMGPDGSTLTASALTVTITYTPAAAGPNEGSASGAIGWAGSATGAVGHEGAASGAIAWVGSATGTAPGGGFAWEDTFAPPNAVSGMTSGDHTAIDEWPWTSDDCFVQHGGSGTGTVTFTFDMSAGPGDKKGFWVWFRSHADTATGYSITEIRLTDGTTTLWTDAAPGISITESTFAASKIRVVEIPDSAFSGDPVISGLVLEFDVSNLDAGNNRLRFSGMRLSKSPFTAAQEASPPASLSGADFSCYRASDLAVLGVTDATAVVVWPDSSGNGRHLIRKTGTGSLYEADTIDYVSFPATTPSVFFGYWGARVTGNHIWHTHIFPEDTTLTQGVFSYNSSFAGVVDPPTDPNDKNILGIDDAGSGDKFLLMSGVGDGPSHKYGATTVTFDAWVRVTEWIQDSGNEHLWINDVATPDVDAASGSNDMLTVTVGNRESEDRPFQGRIGEFWWIDGGSFTETNIDDARDEWVNGPSAGPNEGSASGTIGWAGSATGTTDREGSASGTIGWAGTADGTTSHQGSASGAVDWVGTADGTATHEGSASGAIDWVGSADGEATHEGSAAGSVGWLGSADGAADHEGAATGSIDWVGSAVGEAPTLEQSGSATGSITWAGSADGAAVHEGASTGAIGWAGSATGQATHEGAATGSVSWVGSADGEAPVVGGASGSATGSITWAGSSTGAATHEGSATGTITWSGSADGAAVRSGSATGSVGWAGVANGESSDTPTRPVQYTPTPVPYTPDPVPYTS